MRVQIPSGALKAGLNTESYRPLAIEMRWQEAWEESGAHHTPPPDDPRPPFFVFVTPPFTSGDPHLGHARSYTIGDAYARFKRVSGTSVLFSIGFDAFGLPAELGAAENGIPPAAWVDQCITRMRQQFDRLGLSFDWNRSFASHEPSIYRWTQLIFLLLLERELVYQKEVDVDWCANCETVLAHSQIEAGRCWRCDHEVELRRRLQWFLRLSAYNEENYRRLRDLEWSGPALGAQRAVLGRTEGVELDGLWPDGSKVTLFLPEDQPLSAVEAVLLSPNHPDASKVNGPTGAEESAQLSELRRLRDRAERKRSSDLAIKTASKLAIPALDRELPVLISASVDSKAGPTALLAAPAGSSPHADVQAPEHGQPAVRFRARDFPISRQRSWGTPIPIIHCDRCGAVPASRDELPTRLPESVEAGGRLADDLEFLSCNCPGCGGPGRRETDTLDCHVDAAWAPIPLAVPRGERAEAMFDGDEIRRWMPVDRLVMGSDTGSFMLDMRMTTKALRDAGKLDFIETGEPYTAALMHGMVLLADQKMSKHLKNVVGPAEIIEEFGADALRLALLYGVRPERDLPWNKEARQTLLHCFGFLRRLHTFAIRAIEDYRPVPADQEPSAMRERVGALRISCGRVLDEVTESLENLAMHRACRAAMSYAETLMGLGRQHERSDQMLGEASLESLTKALLLGLQLLAPFAPHLCEELWHRAGATTLISLEPWPTDANIWE